MAHIQKRPDRPKPYRAIIHRKGHELSKSFLEEEDAEFWAREQERSIDLTGMPLTNEELAKVFVKDIIEKYLKEVTPSKGCHVSETTVLKRFLLHPIAKKSLAVVSKKDVYDYRNDRIRGYKDKQGERKKVEPQTVRREINSIQHVFETAKEEWGYTNLVNPCHKLKIKGGEGISRERVLRTGEMEKLEKACRRCHGENKVLVPLAIYLAVETGM